MGLLDWLRDGLLGERMRRRKTEARAEHARETGDPSGPHHFGRRAHRPDPDGHYGFGTDSRRPGRF